MRGKTSALGCLVAATAIGFLSASAASAHPVTSCINQTAAAAQRAGADADFEDWNILVVHPSAKVLQPLLDQMIRCVARILPEQTDRAGAPGQDSQHFWYRSSDKAWCRSTGKVGILGGNSAQRDDHSFFLVCNSQ